MHATSPLVSHILNQAHNIYKYWFSIIFARECKIVDANIKGMRGDVYVREFSGQTRNDVLKRLYARQKKGI